MKKLIELAFNRHGFKYETINAKFLLREQHQDESLASFHEELWFLCDEMFAIRSTGDNDERVNEMRVIDHFAQGLHHRFVRRDVKRFVALNRTNGLLCSMEVFEAATDDAREYAVEENYMSTYREGAIFPSKRVEVKETNIRVFNINQKTIEKRSSDPHDRNREAKCYADKPSRDLTQQIKSGTATGSKNSRSTVRNTKFQDNVFLSSNSEDFDKAATDTWSNNISIKGNEFVSRDGQKVINMERGQGKKFK